METQTSLLPLMQRYFEKDAADAAHGLETMEEEQALAIIRELPPHLSVKAVRHLPDSLAAKLLKDLPEETLKEIVEGLDTQQGVGIFLHLPMESRAKFLEHLSKDKKKKIQELLTYPEDSAGRIMTTDFLAFHADLIVREAVEKVRSMGQRKSSASYIYVVDSENHLVGIMNMRDMLLARDDAKLGQIMRGDVFTVDCFKDREVVANELKTRKYFAAPVVDPEGRLLGVVKVEKLLAGIQEEASEDLQKMFGVDEDERPFSPMLYSLRTRLPWLYVNLAAAFLAASVVSMFESIIAKITVLAVYLPVVAGQGGNAGAQSLAIVMRGLVMREIPARKVKKLLLKECVIGLINGVLIGVVTACIAWLWHGNPFLGLVVGLGMIVNLTIAGLSGCAIPLTMKAVGLDPAQCSNIILTTITDVMGFLSFLGLAVIFQRYLV